MGLESNASGLKGGEFLQFGMGLENNARVEEGGCEVTVSLIVASHASLGPTNIFLARATSVANKFYTSKHMHN